MHQFGDPARFATRYRPCPASYGYQESDKMALCHLIIDNVVIGNFEEECFLPAWYHHIMQNRAFIIANQGNLYSSEFDKLSDREIYEVIIKTNQREDGFDKNYLYLPQLDYSIWQRHLFRMDDTIDAYIICFYIRDGQIRFIADKWWVPDHGKNKTRFVYKSLPVVNFLKILDDTLYCLQLYHPYLTEQKPKKSSANFEI